LRLFWKRRNGSSAPRSIARDFRPGWKRISRGGRAGKSIRFTIFSGTTIRFDPRFWSVGRLELASNCAAPPRHFAVGKSLAPRQTASRSTFQGFHLSAAQVCSKSRKFWKKPRRARHFTAALVSTNGRWSTEKPSIATPRRCDFAMTKSHLLSNRSRCAARITTLFAFSRPPRARSTA